MKVKFVRHLTFVTGEDVGDQYHVGEVHDVSLQVGLFLIAAGWAVAELRSDEDRRHRLGPRPVIDRRQAERRV